MTPLCASCVVEISQGSAGQFGYNWRGQDGTDCTYTVRALDLLESFARGERQYEVKDSAGYIVSPVAVTTLDGRPVCVGHAVSAVQARPPVSRWPYSH